MKRSPSRSLRTAPGGQSKGVVVLLHGWPSDIYDYYKKDGYGLVLANAGWTVYSPFMYHSKDPNLYYKDLKHQHNFVQLSREAKIIGQDILGIEIQKADFLVNYVNYFEKPKTLAVAGVSMGGHYSVILGAINTSIDVTVVSSWFDDYLKKYLDQTHTHQMQYHWHEPVFAFNLFNVLSERLLLALHHPRICILERDSLDLGPDGDEEAEADVELAFDGHDFIHTIKHSAGHNFNFLKELEKYQAK